MDLSWNYVMESQAYDRVYHFEQKKNIFVKRLVVKDTIEKCMLRLQNVKMDAYITIISIPYFSFGINVCLGLADAALDKGTGVKIHKLSAKEIKAVRQTSHHYPGYKCFFFYSSLA
jgi:hypothetical protein